MKFYKYHGAGNDFIMLDNREGSFDASDTERIKLLCHRHFGISADGMLLVENDTDTDFKMVYINSDGSMGSMCGNGGRCIVRFANDILKIIKDPGNVKFRAVDGVHEAKIIKNEQEDDEVSLKMQEVKDIGERNGFSFLYSGTTPHHIAFVENLTSFPICTEARKVRDADPDPKGVNINYVEIKEGVVFARTYERGVEDETLACGTGATSIAIALHHLGKITENSAVIKMPGGDLKISFKKVGDTYQNIWLSGPTKLVFKGETSI